MTGHWLSGYYAYWHTDAELEDFITHQERAGWLTAASEVAMGHYQEIQWHPVLGLNSYGISSCTIPTHSPSTNSC